MEHAATIPIFSAATFNFFVMKKEETTRPLSKYAAKQKRLAEEARAERAAAEKVEKVEKVEKAAEEKPEKDLTYKAALLVSFKAKLIQQANKVAEHERQISDLKKKMEKTKRTIASIEEELGGVKND